MYRQGCSVLQIDMATAYEIHHLHDTPNHLLRIHLLGHQLTFCDPAGGEPSHECQVLGCPKTMFSIRKKTEESLLTSVLIMLLFLDTGGWPRCMALLGYEKCLLGGYSWGTCTVKFWVQFLYMLMTVLPPIRSRSHTLGTRNFNTQQINYIPNFLDQSEFYKYIQGLDWGIKVLPPPLGLPTTRQSQLLSCPELLPLLLPHSPSRWPFVLPDPVRVRPRRGHCQPAGAPLGPWSRGSRLCPFLPPCPIFLVVYPEWAPRSGAIQRQNCVRYPQNRRRPGPRVVEH